MRTLLVATAMLVATAAWASQVTTADLSGHKICWSSGVVSTYAPGGGYTSGTLAGPGTWAITNGGVTIYGSAWSGFVDIDKLANGTFKSDHLGGVGKYCK